MIQENWYRRKMIKEKEKLGKLNIELEKRFLEISKAKQKLEVIQGDISSTEATDDKFKLEEMKRLNKFIEVTEKRISNMRKKITQKMDEVIIAEGKCQKMGDKHAEGSIMLQEQRQKNKLCEILELDIACQQKKLHKAQMQEKIEHLSEEAGG